MRILLFTLLLVSSSRVFAQINYVLNPGFEQYTKCPSGYDEIANAKHWTSIDSNGVNGKSYCLAEYCNICSQDERVSIPRSAGYWQLPHSGDAFALFRVLIVDASLSGPDRDYLQGRLRLPLVKGKQYCVSFYVSLAEQSGYAVKELAAYLDNGAIDTTSNCTRPQTQALPQITNFGAVLTDTGKWIRIQGNFTANGTERYITLGNFKSAAQTTVQAVNNGWHTTTPNSFYLIDDVSVIESDLPADAGPNKVIGKGDSVYIGRPKEVGLECTWSVLGSSTVIGTGAGLWVKPQKPTEYVVTQTLCGVTKKDTVWVGVWGVGVPNVAGVMQQYSLAPNPSSGKVQLSQSIQDERPLTLQVVEATGRLVHEQTAVFSNGKLSLDLSHLAPGCYFIQLKDGEGNTSSLRMLKQ